MAHPTVAAQLVQMLRDADDAVDPLDVPGGRRRGDEDPVGPAGGPAIAPAASA